MRLELDIPDDSERLLRDAWGPDLDRAALEALVIEGYRSGRLTLMQVGQLIGVDNRWAANQWLADRKVWLDYTPEDLERDRAALDLLTRRPRADEP